MTEKSSWLRRKMRGEFNEFLRKNNPISMLINGFKTLARTVLSLSLISGAVIISIYGEQFSKSPIALKMLGNYSFDGILSLVQLLGIFIGGVGLYGLVSLLRRKK